MQITTCLDYSSALYVALSKQTGPVPVICAEKHQESAHSPLVIITTLASARAQNLKAIIFQLPPEPASNES